MANVLDIVLLGSQGAGKTSLIGALVQAAQSQANVLHAQLKTPDKPLAELREATYRKGPAPTKEEVQSITVTMEPLPESGEPAVHARLTDCSGAAAQPLLAGKAPLEAGTPLARAVRHADTVLMVIDAAAEPGQAESVFADLGRFLERFQETRGRRADIAGLPVYLVLNKTDLLAKAGDTHGQWLQKLEEAKRRLAERFQEFAETQADLPFGGIELHVWATAIKRPTLADRPAQPQEPYGVAELFRQMFASAREFQQARDQASGRLSLAVLGTFTLLGALAAVAATFYLFRPSMALTDLENRVQIVLQGSTSSERLREPLDERHKELRALQEHELFGELPPKLQEEVRGTEQEIEAYQKSLKELSKTVPDPRFATREEELSEIAKNLEAFRLPPAYASAWNDTKLVKRLTQWQFDLQKLREAVAQEQEWLKQQVKEGEALLKKGGLVLANSLEPAERDAWFINVKQYLERELPHKRSERVAPGSSMTYDHVYNFQSVQTARKEWDRTKEKLRELRSLAQ